MISISAKFTDLPSYSQVFFIGGIKDLAKAVEEKRLHTFLQAEHKIYGPIVAYPGPAQLSVSVNDPELVREVFNQVSTRR